jgi:hypothetical protein
LACLAYWLRLGWRPKRPIPASLSSVVSVDGAIPTPSCVPKGKAGDGGRAYVGLVRVCVGYGGGDSEWSEPSRGKGWEVGQ